MHKKKRQKQKSLLLVLVLLFNLVIQAAVPMIAYATTTEDTPSIPTIEETSSDVLSIAEARAQESGEVLTQGIVTAKLKHAIYIQDETAAIASKQTDLDVKLGDKIIIQGKLNSENGLLFFEEVDLKENLGNTTIPRPVLLTQADFEDHPDELAVMNEVKILSADENDQGITYTALDSKNHEFFIRDDKKDLDLAIEETYASITGIIAVSNDEKILMPRSFEDIVPQDVEEQISKEQEKDLVGESSDLVEEEAHFLAEDPIETLQEDYFNLSVMHMNDTHARTDKFPKMITAIKEYRKKYPESLLFHAGDVFSGTLYFNEHKGLADVALMNLMDIDAMVFGNHEFDLGEKENGNKSLSEFVKKANFPLLGTNIDFSEDPYMKDLDTAQSLVKNPEAGKSYDSIVLDVDGESIGVFGLVTEDTEVISSGKDVKFKDYIKSAEKAVEEFKNAGIDKIIAVTHLGYDGAPEIGNDRLLAKEVEGIDIIIGGHSHTELKKPVVIKEDAAGKEKDPTVIVQAGEYANNLGTLQVKFDAKGRVVESDGELLPVKEYKEDDEALKVLQPFKEKVEETNKKEIGAVAMKDLLNPRHGEGSKVSVRADETELGNLITDAMLAKAKEKYPETVIAFQNGGGIRAPIMKGPITVGEVINVLPFGNDPVVATLTGQEIKEILEHSVRNAPEENGGFLHISGMKYYYDSKKAPGQRVVKMYIEQEGKLTGINLDETYSVTTNGFTGRGGDGFETFAKAFEEGRVKDIGEIDWEQLRDYMVEERYLNGVVDPVIEGRINDLKGEELPDDEKDEQAIIDELKERIKKLEEALKNLEAENKDLAGQLADLYKLLAALQGDLEAGNVRIEELEKKIAELEARIAELEQQTPDDSKAPPKDSEKEKNGKDGNGKDGGKDDGKGNGKDKPDKGEKPDDPKGILPKTGTNESAYLVVGFILLAGGTILFIIRKRKTENE